MLEELIIEDYFDGQLTPIQKTNFEKYFLRVESRRWKLRIQQLLDQVANEKKNEKKTKEFNKKFWESPILTSIRARQKLTKKSGL